MSEYITFITNHPVLFAGLIAVLAMLIMNLFGPRMRGYNAVSPTEATALINRNDATVLDIRDDGDYHAGHIVNALHIPQSNVSQRLAELEKHKHKPIIVGCRNGNRSRQICALLKKQGFDHIYNLTGGVAAWQNANLPLVKK